MEVAERSAPAIRRLLHFDSVDALEIGAADVVFDAPGVEAVAAECAGIVLASGDAMRAATLLAAGASCVLLGDAALADGDLIVRLASAHGSDRIGIHVPARRMEVCWAMDTVSNPDFRFLAPSVCEPCWEILTADGGRTGARADWWIGEMMKRGASTVLMRADIRDDNDLNLCAGLVECLGDALWFGPLEEEAPALGEWVELCALNRICLPLRVHANREALLSARST